MIHVCFGLHDGDGRYSKFVGTTMASIFENTLVPVTIHILHDATLVADNRDKFSYLAGRYGQRVQFHDVEQICADDIKFLRDMLADKIRLRFSIGAFYRLLIKKILAPLKIDKAIYLDADIIVNMDIDELWRHDLKNFPLAAVPEELATFDMMIDNKFVLKSGRVRKENYFCSGVIVFNLNEIADEFFHDGVQFLVDNPKCESPDQDILNSFFSTNYLKLEQKFDSFVPAERLKNFSVAKKIYHYAGQSVELKPDDEFNELFLGHFARTPWLNVDALFGIGEGFRRSNDEFTMRFQWLMRLTSQHRRAFFVSPNNIDAVKSIFDIQDDEPIIELHNRNSLDRLIDIMRDFDGQKVVLLFQDNYDAFRSILSGNGFREHVHFANGLRFMNREQCRYEQREWALVRNM